MVSSRPQRLSDLETNRPARSIPAAWRARRHPATRWVSGLAFLGPTNEARHQKIGGELAAAIVARRSDGSKRPLAQGSGHVV
jgi:hypothetical protein